ncbi:hypothetical protein [Nannocystis pusilla]|uniref:hypothetical protein n=1 Tax=Nannocystis pusilla TaxID=889268 RepID=UPI003B7ECE17
MLVTVGQALGRAVRVLGFGLDVDEVEVAFLLDIVDAGAQGRRRQGTGPPEHHLHGIAIEQGLHDRHLHRLSGREYFAAAAIIQSSCFYSIARHTGA